MPLNRSAVLRRLARALPALLLAGLLLLEVVVGGQFRSAVATSCELYLRPPGLNRP